MNRLRRRQRAKLRRVLLGLGVGSLSIVQVAGLFMSPIHREVARIRLPSSPETIWSVLTDLDGMPEWRPELDGLERLPDSGHAVRWREVTGDSDITLERIEAVPPERMVVRTVGARAPRRWTYAIAKLASGSEVTVVEEHRIGIGALRAIARLFGTNRQWMDDMTSGLAARLAGHRDQIVGASP